MSVFLVLQHAPSQIEDAALVSFHEEGKGILVSHLLAYYPSSVIESVKRMLNQRE
jgi:hypothetical protein